MNVYRYRAIEKRHMCESIIALSQEEAIDAFDCLADREFGCDYEILSLSVSIVEAAEFGTSNYKAYICDGVVRGFVSGRGTAISQKEAITEINNLYQDRLDCELLELDVDTDEEAEDEDVFYAKQQQYIDCQDEDSLPF